MKFRKYPIATKPIDVQVMLALICALLFALVWLSDNEDWIENGAIERYILAYKILASAFPFVGFFTMVFWAMGRKYPN